MALVSKRIMRFRLFAARHQSKAFRQHGAASLCWEIPEAKSHRTCSQSGRSTLLGITRGTSSGWLMIVGMLRIPWPKLSSDGSRVPMDLLLATSNDRGATYPALSRDAPRLGRISTPKLITSAGIGNTESKHFRIKGFANFYIDWVTNQASPLRGCPAIVRRHGTRSFE